MTELALAGGAAPARAETRVVSLALAALIVDGRGAGLRPWFGLSVERSRVSEA